MDIQDCPAKHPGPWQKIKDSPDQAQLRKELARAGKIVFSSNRDGNWEIYVINADGSEQKNLTRNPAWDMQPRWTPDGKQIVFFSDRDSKVKMSQIFNQLMEPVVPVGPWTFARYPSSYNGSRAEELDVMPQCGVYIMDADGANVKLLVKDARRANLSRDGKFLIFERKGVTVTRNLAAGEEWDAVQRYFGGSWWPEFSPDGKGFVAVQGLRELRLQEFDLAEQPNEQGWLGGKTIGLATPADRYLHAFPAYSPGGKHIAFSLSPVHFLVREQIVPLGYKAWQGGNQIIWQELCVGRAEAAATTSGSNSPKAATPIVTPTGSWGDNFLGEPGASATGVHAVAARSRLAKIRCQTLLFSFAGNNKGWGAKKMADRIKVLSSQFMAERHSLLGFIYGMVRDLAVAEDILQEVWIRLADAAERNEPIENLVRWCRGVAKNLILHHWRDRRAAKVVADSEMLDLVEQAMEEATDHWADRRQALMECIDRLPSPSKQLLHLKFDRGLTFAAMAELLKRTKDSLKMALCRLRQALLECAERKLRPTEENA